MMSTPYMLWILEVLTPSIAGHVAILQGMEGSQRQEYGNYGDHPLPLFALHVGILTMTSRAVKLM